MFEPGQRVKAHLRKGQIIRQGEDRIIDLYRYTVTAVDGDTVGLDDGHPATRWPADHFKAEPL